jgi:hypothetical protein
MDSTCTDEARASDPGLAKEVRQSLLLLTVSVAVTAAVTVAAQATVSLLG